MYGPDCTRNCGRCKYGVPCSMDTGACPGECEEGWIGERCATCMLIFLIYLGWKIPQYCIARKN